MFLGHILHRAIVLPQDNGWTCRPQALLLFDDGVVLQFVVPNWLFGTNDDALESPHWPDVDFQLTDDVGTTYQGNSGSSIGTQMGEDGRTSLHGRFIFTPPVPADARRIVIAGNEGDLSVALA
jgi:hypothetical protein